MSTTIFRESKSGAIKLQVGDWKYITDEKFCSTFKNDVLLWNCLDNNVLLINPNSGLVYACGVGSTTIFATDVSSGTIKIFCSVEVEETKVLTQSALKSSQDKSTPFSVRCCDSEYYEITSMGYSGTIFGYKPRGNYVTLEKGWLGKSKNSNYYSELFRCTLIKMNNIYASMSEQQRAAWLKLRLIDLFGLIDIVDPTSLSETAKNIAKEILSNMGIDLGGMLEATILGLYDWYLAEDEAVSYFKAF